VRKLVRKNLRIKSRRPSYSTLRHILYFFISILSLFLSAIFPIVEKQLIDQQLAEILNSYEQGRDNLVLDLSTIMENEYLSKRLSASWGALESREVSKLETILKLQSRTLPPKMSVVDYGPGSGWKGAEVCKILMSLGVQVEKIHHIDSSPAALVQARAYCEDQGLSVHTHRPVKFEDLGPLTELRKDRNRKLHLFLGQTVGNSTQPDIVARNIAENMRKRDLLIVEWFANEPENYRSLEKFYRDYLQRIIHFPVEAIGEYNPTTDEEKNWNLMQFRVSDVPLEQRLLEVSGRKYELKPGTKVIVSRSRRFKETEVIKLFEREVLEGQVLKTWETPARPVSTAYGTVYMSGGINQQKWEVWGNKRYALFKKTLERKSLQRIHYGLGLLATGAAVFLWLNAGPITSRISKSIDDFLPWIVPTFTAKLSTSASWMNLSASSGSVNSPPMTPTSPSTKTFFLLA